MKIVIFTSEVITIAMVKKYLDVLKYDRNIIDSSSEIFGYSRKSSVIFGKCWEMFLWPLDSF